MQIFLYDRVLVKDGVVDEDTGASLAGLKGVVSNIGYRDEKYPFTIDVRDDENSVSQYYFSYEEIEVVEDESN